MRRDRGLTAVEVVIVVVILAVILAVLFPLATRARERNRREICKMNVRQISLGANMYGNDFGDWYPTMGVNVPKGEEQTLWSLSLLRCCYVTASKVFVCPSTRDRPERLVTRNHRVWSAMTPNGCSYAYDPQKPPGTPKHVAICADKPSPTNPGSRNSINHKNEGQNVLYFDGRVAWTDNANAGLNGDNIFTGTWSGPGNTLPITDSYCTVN